MIAQDADQLDVLRESRNNEHMTQDQAVDRIIDIEHCDRERALELTIRAADSARLWARTPRIIVTFDARIQMFSVDYNG